MRVFPSERRLNGVLQPLPIVPNQSIQNEILHNQNHSTMNRAAFFNPQERNTRANNNQFGVAVTQIN